MQDTTSFERIEALDKRINIIQGGTSAGKTISMLMVLLDIATTEPGVLISVVTDSFPNLERGAIRDFRNILRLTNRGGYWRENQTKHTFTSLFNESVIEFFSVDDMGALGARRDYLFINEANRIDYETFTQLETRTKVRIWLDFNPKNEFWVHTELVNKRMKDVGDVSFIKLNYTHNEALEPSIIATLEARRGDGNNNWWRVFGLGEIGTLEGNVYEGWLTYEELPEGAILKRYGVDFGFSNDPTAVVAVYEAENGAIYLKTQVLQTKLLTPQLCELLKGLEPALFVCDNARPEIIAELNANGIRAIGCDKTPGEKMNGKRYNIELVQRRRVFYYAADKELEREYLTYAWRKKKSTGEILDEPQDGNDHCMDAIAYAVRDMEKKPLQYGRVF